MKRIDETVRRELGRFGPQAGIGPVVEAWPAAVGEAIARNAWPARIARDGTLHVHASSSSWAFELAQLESTLRERLRERLGDRVPPRLRFAPGPLPEAAPPAPAEVADETVEVLRAHREEAARLVAGIENAPLRETVARAVAAALARSASDRGF